ncbi:hypothetical protein CC79DRAFT_1360854 [Sarocladium strictum]
MVNGDFITLIASIHGSSSFVPIPRTPLLLPNDAPPQMGRNGDNNTTRILEFGQSRSTQAQDEKTRQLTEHISIRRNTMERLSHPSILIARGASPSTSTSSTSSDPQSSKSGWSTSYCKLPKKRSFSFRFMTWAAGRPRKANYMKKKCRDKDMESELFHVSTTTLIGSVLGRWPRETKMYWMTMEADKDDEKKKDGKKGDDDKHVMSGGLGNGAEGVPIYQPPPPGVEMHLEFITQLCWTVSRVTNRVIMGKQSGSPGIGVLEPPCQDG